MARIKNRSSASRGGNGSKGRSRGSKRKNKFKSGDWNLISDFSGQKIKASDSRLTWQGYRVHRNEWEPKHPQLNLRGHTDKISVPFSRPRQPDTFEDGDVDDL